LRKVAGTEALARVRQLRREMTPAEKLLWGRLRGRRLEGFKFRSQVWLGTFIADFFCWEAKLVVEVDGAQHAERRGYDAARTRRLERDGYMVLRFWNNEVLQDLVAVLAAIRTELLSRVPSPSHPAAQGGPLPLPEGERGA
jgi:very-short-patch-repair endonuclease